MKICMYSIGEIASNKTGGVKRYNELMAALVKYGHDVYVLSPDDKKTFANRHVTFLSMKTDKDKQSLIGVRAVIRNIKHIVWIKHEKFDRVIVFDIRAAISLALYNVPNIYLFLRQDLISYKTIELEDKKVTGYKRKVYLMLMIIAEYLCLKRAKIIVVQCKADLMNLLMRHKQLEKSIIKKSIIQINNVNPSWVLNDEETSKEKKYDLVFVGNFRDSRKGHHLLLQSLAELADEGCVLNTAIIGDGVQLEDCKKNYSQYKNILFLGRLSNPLLTMKSSKLMVVPSYADSCPNTVMEALYNNVPVIGANSGGIPEILNNRKWLFALNTSSLKQSIIHWIDDKNNRLLLNEQSNRRDELMFDWGKKVVEIIEKRT